MIGVLVGKLVVAISCMFILGLLHDTKETLPNVSKVWRVLWYIDALCISFGLIFTTVSFVASVVRLIAC